MKTRISIVLLYVASFFASIGPAMTYFLINYDKYITTVPDKVKVSAGMTILAIIVFLKLIGKLNVSSRVAVFGVIFILAFLLESLIDDILIFSFLALVGEIADVGIMMIVKKLKNDALLKKGAKANAEATASEIENALEKVVSGRT